MLLFFNVNKFSLGEQKRLPSKTIKILPTTNSWTVVYFSVWFSFMCKTVLIRGKGALSALVDIKKTSQHKL